MKKHYDDDDGRTIADMSGVSRPSLFVPRQRPQDAEPDGDSERLPWDESGRLSKGERRAYIGGAMGAALLIGGVFIACGAVLILLLQFFWNK